MTIDVAELRKLLEAAQRGPFEARDGELFSRDPDAVARHHAALDALVMAGTGMSDEELDELFARAEGKALIVDSLDAPDAALIAALWNAAPKFLEEITLLDAILGCVLGEPASFLYALRRLVAAHDEAIEAAARAEERF